MRRFRRILVAVRGEHPPRGLIERAVALARENHAALKLVSVVQEIPWYGRKALPVAEDLLEIVVRERSAELERIVAQLLSDGLSVTTSVLRGRPAIEIVREVIRGKHDLVIKAAEPNHPMHFGSTDMHLLRACPCPLWLFKPGHEDHKFTRVLAAVDPVPPPDEADLLQLQEPLDRKDPRIDSAILELADALARDQGAELHVVHAWSATCENLVRGDAILAQSQVERYVADEKAAASKALENLLGSVKLAHQQPHIHLVKGDPADVISELAARMGADLVVMGTVARSGIPGLLIGNTAENVFQRVDCSVLALKPEGFVSPVSVHESSVFRSTVL